MNDISDKTSSNVQNKWHSFYKHASYKGYGKSTWSKHLFPESWARSCFPNIIRVCSRHSAKILTYLDRSSRRPNAFYMRTTTIACLKTLIWPSGRVLTVQQILNLCICTYGPYEGEVDSTSPYMRHLSVRSMDRTELLSLSNGICQTWSRGRHFCHSFPVREAKYLKV